MPEGTAIEIPRKLPEMPRSGMALASLLDHSSAFKFKGQPGSSHRHYVHVDTGEKITVIATNKDLKDTHRKVWEKTRKKLAGWGIIKKGK